MNEEELQSIKERFLNRATNPPVIPPDHIVNGECSVEELNRYLTINPVETIRAIDAYKMLSWMYPQAFNQIAPMNTIRDILGDSYGSAE